LPPGVHDGATVVADDVAIPPPGFRVDGLADCTQQPKAVELVTAWPLLAPFNKGADRGRSGVENRDLMAVNHVPEPVGLGMVRRSLVHQGGGAVLQRTVHNVAVSRDPTDVGSTPIGVFVLQIKYQLRGDVSADGIAAGGVDHALGFTGGARGVKNIEGVFGVERLGGTDRVGLARHQLVPPMIATGLHVDFTSGATIDDYTFH